MRSTTYSLDSSYLLLDFLEQKSTMHRSPTMENSWIFLSFLSAAALVLFSKLIANHFQPKKTLPPGPKPWPIIGNLNLLGSLPHQSLHHLSQIYGEIMLLKFGKFPVVVASSPEMAKQFLRTHDTVFASRPAHASGYHLSFNYSDMSFSPYGPYWRQTRKICLSEVFNAKKLDSFEQIRVDERRAFFSRLRGLSRKPIVLRDHLLRYALSTISRVLTREKYFSESEEENSIVNINELREMVDEWFLLNGVFNIGDWIPWLAFLDLQGYVGKMKALRKKVDRFYDQVIDDHLARKAAEEGSEGKDLVDVLLEMAEDPNLEVPLTRDNAKALIQNLLVGGTDTTTATVEWAILEILRKPHIMEKAKEELKKVIGRNKWVEENDLPKLPYIDAIIAETFRLHPIATLLPPHYAIGNCNVAGYDISKGTTVLVNTWSLRRDSNSWDAPEEFLPERFLGKEIDLKGNNFALLPFGSGRRRCPGYNLGLKMVRTTLANLLHGFELKLIEGMGPKDICIDEEYALTTHAKHPISIIMEPTLPLQLY